MRESDDLSMYEDEDDDGERSIKPVSTTRRTAKTTEIRIFDQTITVINPDYVDELHRLIARSESKIKDLDLMIKRLNMEIRNMKTELDRHGKK